MPGTPLFAHHSGSTKAAVTNPLDADLNRETVTDLPPEQLAQLMRSAWRGFYLRPGPIRRLAVDAVRSGSIGEAVRLGRAWTRWTLSRKANR